MDLNKHCELCENRLFDMEMGSVCGLSNQKPAFKTKCSEINFGDNHLAKIKKTNIDFYKIEATRYINISHFILYLTIGVIVIFGGYFLGTEAWDKGVISTVPLIIIGIGVSFIPIASGPLINFYQKLNVEKKRKKTLDELLKTYNFEYSCEVEVQEDVHGNKEYEAKVNFLRKHFK